MKIHKNQIFVVVFLLLSSFTACSQKNFKINRHGENLKGEELNSELSKTFNSGTTFLVDNFSDEYYGKVHISDTSEVFSPGWISIIEKKTERELIKVDAEELTFDLHEGEILANIKELPYGEQSSILFEDFNFDGMKDFAIMDGQNSCYHGPSYQIFLATPKGFTLSPEFTSLAQDYCGMFDVDISTQRIFTMTKSGCCWHQFSEFKVKNNIPYPIKVVEESLSFSGLTWDYSEENLINEEIQYSDYQMLAVELNTKNLLLQFEIDKGKKMQIFIFENQLHYAFLDAEEKIELLYSGDFQYDQKKNTLNFFNLNTQYSVYEDAIRITTSSKNQERKSIKGSQVGSLKNLNKEQFTKLKNLK